MSAKAQFGAVPDFLTPDPKHLTDVSNQKPTATLSLYRSRRSFLPWLPLPP